MVKNGGEDGEMVSDKSLELSIALRKEGKSGPMEGHRNIDTGLLVDQGEDVLGGGPKSRLDNV